MKSCDSVSDNLVWPRSSVCWAEEGQDEYEDDGFIVSDVEEEEEQEEEEEDRDGAEERQKKKKRRKRLRFPLFFCPCFVWLQFILCSRGGVVNRNRLCILYWLVSTNYRESERNYVLDEDDYELLQESNISVPRPKVVNSFASFYWSPLQSKLYSCSFWSFPVSLLGEVQTVEKSTRCYSRRTFWILWWGRVWRDREKRTNSRGEA